MWGLLLTVLAIGPYAMTSSFHIKKKYENRPIAFMMPFPTPEQRPGRKVARNVTQWRKEGDGALAALRDSSGPGVHAEWSVNSSSSRGRDTSHHLKYHFSSWEQAHQIFFYRISVPFLNQQSITSIRQKSEPDLVSEIWAQIPALALTHCELSKWSIPSRFQFP